MKKIATLLFATAFTLFATAQTMPSLIAAMNEKAKETHGIIRMFSSKKAKVEIKDNEVTACDMGVRISVKLDQEGYPVSTYSYEFDPADIYTVTEVDMPRESPVGQLKISFLDALSLNSEHTKKEGTTRKFSDEVVFNFLKVDRDNFIRIKDLLYKMRDLAKSAKESNAKQLAGSMSTSKPFWFAGDGASLTYNLKKVVASECELRFYYSLEIIGKKGDVNEKYLTVVPFSSINDISLDKSKSRPGCVMLHSNKKGFTRYKRKDGDYVENGTTDEIPFFIDASSSKYEAALENLKKLVKSCGGGRLKL